MVEKFLSVVAPHVCVVCGNEGSVLCAWCKFDAVPSLPEICYQCRQLSPDSAVCAACRRVSPLKYVWVRANYAGPAKDLIQLLKFQRAKAASQIIADLIQEVLPYLSSKTIITYVPAATTRIRLRGYDQSQLLSKAVAHYAGRPQATLLARLGQARQVGASRKQRLEQLNGAFRPLLPQLIKGAEIVIVDDVLTTGASLEAAAKAFKKAGAKTVSGLIFAR